MNLKRKLSKTIPQKLKPTFLPTQNKLKNSYKTIKIKDTKAKFQELRIGIF